LGARAVHRDGGAVRGAGLGVDAHHPLLGLRLADAFGASVDGVLAIRSRQSSSRDLGIGLVIPVIVLAANWIRTAWWRD
jgi:hypothetical protein